MPIAAKAFFVVTAGILLDEPMPEYSRQVGYTSADFDQDLTRPPSEDTIYMQRREEALEHARRLMDPRAVNWVKLEWVWV